MKHRNVIFGALVSALLAGCGSPESGLSQFDYCSSDDECAGTQVCFPDGCGDPGSNIAVEVQPSAASGQLAQDFEVFEVRHQLDFQALQPSVLVGEVTQVSTTGESAGFAGDVTVSANGESLLIPGRLRSAQFTVALDQGAFSVPIPSGLFTVAVQPSNGLAVPLYEPNVVVLPGNAAKVNFSMPAIAQLQRLDGRLLQNAEENLAIQTTVMDVQAFDLATGLPISQKAQVSSGQMGSTGDFILFFRAPNGATSVQVKASPREPTAFVPTKTFTVSLSDKSVKPLELGDYGAPVTVTGVVTGTDNQPLANARVYLEGRVGGGGTFKSATATSDASGKFTVRQSPLRQER